MRKKLPQGRPRLKPSEYKTCQLACKCTEAYFVKFKAAAWEKGIPMAQYVLTAVKEKYERESKQD